MTRFYSVLVQVLTIFILFSVPDRAQTPTTGQITGTITDPGGGVVPGTQITVSGSAGITRTGTSGEGGRYVFSLLPPGSYRLETQKPGFAITTLEDVVVRITETTALDVRLQVATQKAAVQVTSEAPMVQAESAGRGQVIGSTTIRQLPLATRNFQQLLTLTPGASSSVPNSSDLGRGDTTFSVNGQRTLSNAVVINGVDASSIGTGSTPNLAVPASDTLQEFIVQTNLYDASQGRNAGSIVAAVTRSGTNEIHGSLYEFLRNDELNANNFFLNRAGVPRPTYKRNQFGGTVGAPIIKNRVWFFGSYQGTREVNGTSLSNSISTVFVPGDLANDRSLPTLDTLAASYGIPSCTSPLAAQGCLNPTSVALLQAKLPNGQYIVPSATNPVAIPVGHPVAPVPVPVVGLSRFQEDQFNSNLDVKISSGNRLSGKFFWADNPETQALYNSYGLGNALPSPGFGAAVNYNQRLLAVDDTQSISSAMVNDLRFGYSNITTSASPQEPFTAAQLGIKSPLSGAFSGMPEINVNNEFDLGASPFSDNRAKEPTYMANDTLSWTKGKHTLRLGADYKNIELTEKFNLYTRGQMFFLGFSGDPFRDFLGGFFDLTSLTIMGSGVNNRDVLSHAWAGFGNDDWRLTKNLTLTLGLRYEYFSPFTEAQGRYVGIDQSLLKTVTIPGSTPATGTQAVVAGFVQADNAKAPLPGVPLVQSSLVAPDKNNFSPRFGFAYQPFATATRAFVLRGGYGIYYDRPNSRFINNQLLNFPYYTLAQAFTTPINNPFVQVPPPAAFPLTFNSPAFPFGGPPAFLPAPTTAGLQAVPANGIYPDINNFRTPYVQQFSLGAQTEFATNWLLDISYVGSLGRKLLRLQDLNQEISPVAGAPGPYSPGLSSLAVQGFGVHVMQSSANSSYHSLQASLTKRMSNGLQFLAAYTWSHSIDDYSGDSTGTSDVTVVPGNQVLLKNRGSSDFDRRQRFVFSGVYELPPVYKGSRFGRELLNGWEVASIFTIQSGTPFSVLTAENAFVQARANWNPSTPNCQANPGGGTNARLNQYFNVSCFAQAVAPGDFGNTGRNLLSGPAQLNVDFSAVKFFRIRERSNLEFRAEFFNIFNNVSFSNPVNILQSTNIGSIVNTTTGPRVIQFAMKLNF